MHNRHDKNYSDIAADVKQDLLESVELARQAGVREDKIVLDPGIGFAKDYEHNLELIARLSELHELGYPILLATSRKRFIQRTLDLSAGEVLEGTAATVSWGIAHGCDIVRVHDVAQIVRTVRMTDAIARFFSNLEYRTEV
jgi:dihydropteroate synthase